MSVNKTSPSFSRLVLLFSGIIAALIAITANKAEVSTKSEYIRQKQHKLDQALDITISKTSEEAFVFQKVNKIINKANKGSNKITDFVNKIQNNTGMIIQFFLFKNNQLKISLNAPKETTNIIKKLPEYLTLKGEEFFTAQRDVQVGLMNLFGPGSRLELIKEWQGKLKKYTVEGINGYVFWDRYEDKTIFIITNKIPSFVNRFKLFRIQGNSIFGAANPANDEWVPPAGFTEDQMHSAYIKSNLSGKNHCNAFGHSWYFTKDAKNDVWCSILKNSQTSNRLLIFTLWFGAIISIFCFIMYFFAVQNIFPGTYISNLINSVSIKYRLFGLFTMASVFPILLSIFIGSASIVDKKNVIQNRVLSNSISSLNQLEQLYTNDIDATKELTSELRKILTKSIGSLEILNKLLTKYDMPKTLTRLETRDGQGNLLFTTDDPLVSGSTKAMEVFGRVAIRHHAPQRMGASINKTTPGEILTESVMSTDKIGMATILRQRGKVWFSEMGTFPVLWYWEVFPETSSNTAFVFFSNQLSNLYDRSILKNLNKKLNSSGTFQLGLRMNREFFSFDWIPDSFHANLPNLKDAAVRAYCTGEILFREAIIGNTKYWVTIKAEKKIHTSVFLNFTPLKKELAVIQTMKWELFAGGLLALIISFLAANLISRLIILPIQDLGNGISSIKNRDSEFRIPVRRNDEFGQLATAFNAVIEDLKELEYGKIVQEKLLPSDPECPNGYDLACFRTSATDLAGDYHDVIALDNGKYAIILGDVTGHGISAALAMAMAKATVDFQKRNGSMFPAPLLDKLNSLFNKELKPKHKFMTFACMVLDPKSNALEIENAGQSYPFYFTATDGSVREIKMPSMPLGATKKRRGKGQLLEMQKGDAIILYSDGIIECSNPRGKMFGYARFMQLFNELLKAKLPSARILKTLMENLDSFRAPGPYPDDVTLVVLQRKR